MKPSEVLRAAKALIDTPEKWCQNHSVVGIGDARRMCAGYAVVEVEGASGCKYESLTYLSRIVAPDGVRFAPISNWNDVPERTHAEVMTAFDKAIALAESENR